MDGVLANVFEQYVALDEKHTGRRKSAEEVRGISEMEAFERAREYILTEGLLPECARYPRQSGRSIPSSASL